MESNLERLSAKLAKSHARIETLRVSITRALIAQRLRDALTYAKDQGVDLPVTWETEFAPLHGWVGTVKTLQRKLRRARQVVEALEKEVSAAQKAASAPGAWPADVYNPSSIDIMEECHPFAPCYHRVRFLDADGCPCEQDWGALKIRDWHVVHGMEVPKHFAK